METRRPARALVDGIPLYAPGDQFALPDVGFETMLPMLEVIRDVELAGMHDAIVRGDLDAAAAALAPARLDRQLDALGNTASILGDEAYTALSLKVKYASSAKRVQTRLSSTTTSSETDLLRNVDELEAILNEYINLIPPAVVKQVRARERRLAQLASGNKPSEPEDEPTTTSPAIVAVPAGSFLMTPGSGQQVCGRDIRC